MKHTQLLINKITLKFFLILFLLLSLTSCSSPEEVKQDHYQNGMELLEEKDYVKASIEFRNALQIDDTFVPAWFGLAKIENENQEWERLVALLNKVIELEPTHIDAQVMLGNLMIMAGQLDRAVSISDATILLDNNNADVLALKAAVLLKLEDTEGAIEFANKSLAVDPKNMAAVQILAAEKYSKRDFDGALSFIEQGLKENERNTDLLLIKIQTLDAKGDIESAKNTYEELISYYPNDKDIRISFVNFYVKNGDQASAEQQLRAIAQQDPTDFDSSIDVVRFLNTFKGPEAAEAELQTLIQKGTDVIKYQLALSEFYVNGGKKDQAKEVLNRIVESTGSSEDGLIARARLGEMALTDNDNDEALKIIEDILAIDSANVSALEMRSSIRISENKYDDAIQDLRIVLGETPESVRASALLSKAYELNGSIELADDALADAFRFSNNDPAVGISYAEFLMKHSSPARAEDLLVNLANATPNNAEVLKSLAQVKIMRQDWLGAQQVADALEKIEGQNSVTQEIQGMALSGQQNYDQSINAFRNAYTANPEASRPLSSLIGTYIRAGQVNEAKAFLNTVLEENKDNYQANVLMGQIHLLENRPDEALKSFDTAAEIDPASPVAYNNIIAHYVRTNDLTSAMQQIDNALVHVDNDTPLLLMKANIYEREEKYELAINLYEEMYAANPNSDVIINNLASMLSEYRNDNESMLRAQDLAKRFRQSSIPHFKDTLGWIYYKVGDIQSATSMLQDVVEQMPTMSIFRYHLAKIYLAGDRKAAAKREFEEIIRLSENQPFDYLEEVKELLGTLQTEG